MSIISIFRSQWGAWSSCSITCGNIGEGLMSRGRHISVEANYGGRKCSGLKTELQTCFHEDMERVKREKIRDAIYYCSGHRCTVFGDSGEQLQ